MKKFILLLCLNLICNQLAFASPQPNNDGRTKADFVAQAKNEHPIDILDFDINDDKKISYNELQEMIAGFKQPMLRMNDTQKEEIIDSLLAQFKQSDIDNDGYLDANESKDLENIITTLLLSYRFDEMDRNHNGVLDSDDIPPIEESMQKLQEATQKLQEATQKLEETSADEFAANLFGSFSTSLAKEEFFGMDKNKDDCVTADEYVAYNLQAQDRTSGDSDYKINREGFIHLYAMIVKKTPNCLTQEEYLADSQKAMDDVLKYANDAENSDEPIDYKDEKIDNPNYITELADILFIEMDANKDGIVSKEEYVTYKMANDNFPDATPEHYETVFRSLYATDNPDKNEFNKDELIKILTDMKETEDD